jgi:hypothetical protein
MRILIVESIVRPTPSPVLERTMTMQTVPSPAPAQTHIYNLTVSAVAPAAVQGWINGLPERFRNSLYGTTTLEVTGKDAGSVRATAYIMTAATANALRKRAQRKWKGRAKFARLVTR